MTSVQSDATTVNLPRPQPRDPKKGQLLITAGPAKRVDGKPFYAHTSEHFKTVKKQLADRIRQLFRAVKAAWVFAYDPGATFLQEAVMRQLAGIGKSLPQPTVGILANGGFGMRWDEFAEQLGIPHVTTKVDVGQAITPEVFRRALAANPDVKIWFVVHADTSVGVVNPIQELAKILRELHGHEGILVVDAVLSGGAQLIDFDAWGLGVLVGSMGKCLGGGTNYGLCAVSADALKAMEAIGAEVGSPTLGLILWRQKQSNGIFHHTDGVSQAIDALEVLELLIERENGNPKLDLHRMQLRKLSDALQAGLESFGIFEQGFSYLIPAECRASQLLALRLPDWLEGDETQKLLLYLEQNFSLVVGGGLAAFKGKIWRLGVMGGLDIHDLRYFFETVAFAIQELYGRTLKPEEAIEAMMKKYAA